YVDVAGRDLGSYVSEGRRLVDREVSLPTGYSLVWSGSWESWVRFLDHLKVVVPITLFLIIMLLYLNTKSATKTFIVLLSVPFSLIGAVWLLALLGYNWSAAVAVGMIALMGLDAETGVFMLLFLDLAYADAVSTGKMRTREDLREAIIHGAVKRIR